MKRLLAVLLLVPLLSLLAFAGPLKDDMLQHVVHLNTGDAQGSGVCVEHKGKVWILTCSHVVSDLMTPREVEVKIGEQVHKVTDTTPRLAECERKGGGTFKARVVWYSRAWESANAIDLALLEPMDAKGLKGCKLLPKGKEIEEGEDAWYCGSGGAKFVLEKSIVSRLSRRYLDVNGVGWYGHSGSGVFLKRDGTYYLAATLSEFQQHPDDNPKAPLRCERQLHEFFDAVTAGGK